MKALWLFTAFLLLIRLSGYSEAHKTITLPAPASFSIKIPADIEDFRHKPMKYKELRNGACAWQFHGGIFYSVVVHCNEPQKPIALVKYVWFKHEITHWLYDERGIPHRCTIEEYTHEVFGEQLKVNPEFRALMPPKVGV